MPPKLRALIIVLLLINSIGAMVAGFLFMSDPSGGSMGITTETLKYSPFDSFFIPGLVLFLANGIFSLVVVTMILIKSRYASMFLFLQGMILLGWIGIQIILLREINFLHLLMISFALVFLVSGRKFKAQNG